MTCIRDKHQRIMVHFCHQPWLIREYVLQKWYTIIWQFAIQEPIMHYYRLETYSSSRDLLLTAYSTGLIPIDLSIESI